MPPTPRRLQPHPQGYLGLTIDGRYWLAHVLVLLAFKGTAPEGCEACHDPNPDRTDNRPDNLRWDTHKANYADMVRQGRFVSCAGVSKNQGTSHGRAVLTDELVREIRTSKEDGPTIAARLGTTKGNISRIRSRKAWAHVPD